MYKNGLFEMMSMKNVIIIFTLLLCNISFNDWAKPIKMSPTINDHGQSYHGRISPDGKTFYFTVTDPITDDDIWVARRQGNTWTNVQKLTTIINSPKRDLSPSITADENKLYFISYNRDNYSGYQIWCSTWINNCWSEPSNCGSNVNTGSEFTSCIASDGKELYFSSSREGGYGDFDIYVSKWDETSQQWGKPKNLGPKINSGYREYSPWISANNKTLMWASWNSGTRGPAIFSATWNGVEWDSIEKLPAPVNRGSRHWTDSPSLSPDGGTLYFVTDWPDSNKQYQFLWHANNKFNKRKR